MMASLTDRLVDEFLSCSLPKHEWNHHSHLRVGLWYLLHYTPDESLEKLRQRIQLYNLTCGVENTDSQGYHETITRFYLWLIYEFIQSADTSQPIDILANDLIHRYGDKSLPLRYYSEELLMSKTARLEWVEPDVQPLKLTL